MLRPEGMPGPSRWGPSAMRGGPRARPGSDFAMTIRSLPFLLLIAALLPARPTSALAKGPDECLACHNEKGFSMERAGKNVSLYVDPAELARSPHAKLDCIACHKGFKADALPHA